MLPISSCEYQITVFGAGVSAVPKEEHRQRDKGNRILELVGSEKMPHFLVSGS